MRLTCAIAGLVLLNCSVSSAQVFYGAYYAPAPVVMAPQPVVLAPVQTIVPMSYVPQPVVSYSAPVVTSYYAPPVVVSTPVTFAAPYPVLPYSQYRYSVHSRPYGYVVRERVRGW